MYRKSERTVNSCDKFELEGRLSEDNRWVIMAKIIPWAEFEEKYAALFSEQMGAPAKTFRMALGSLIIKEKLGISDIETVEQIRENPYLQYFIGEAAYKNEAPFDPSMLSHFRKRIGIDLVNRINESMVERKNQNDVIEEKDRQKKTEQRKLKITTKEN